MKYLPKSLVAVAFAISAASCNPADNPPATTAGWTLNGVDYSANESEKVEGTMLHAWNNQDGMWIKFKSLPTTSGTYKIVDCASMSFAGDEVGVEFDHGASDVWLSTNNAAANATVTVDGSKINVTVPSIVVKHYNSNGPQSDSTTAGGAIEVD